jgi:ABC-2 type transport system ATP-binding protein
LILYEPTSGLDPNQIIEIRDVIKQLGQNKTVLFSSHILQEVQAICDRVIIINKGTIVADDQLTNLLKKVHAGEVILELKEDVDESVFASMQNGIRINNTTWKSDENSLEDVFRSLTS